MATNLFGRERDAILREITALGEPAYRARQVYVWIYKKRVRSFEAMTNLGKTLREELARRFVLRWPEVAERNLSYDGTVKYLLRLEDGAAIESVYIPEDRRRTICISTQAGCPLRCAFCLTGIAGYRRNLKPAEILGQVALLMEEAPARRQPWNVVMMGMGEPLLNYEATVSALRVLMDPEGFGVAPKKLTLSTVGILPALEKLMREPVRPNLAISLHAPDSALRRALMPVEEKYGIEEVIAAAQRYPIPRGGLVTYEYVLLRGVNDTPGHARELVRLLSGARAKVNLIPLNPAPQIPFEAPRAEAVDAFCAALAEARLTVSVRRPRGQDILAACGQLHLKQGVPAPVPAPPS
ncbi:MAG TPA: 23S rRNA (adenine(2503)-C(2))-methyltransferase RlmN [Vicinamibacteria bacterium]|nr:23S rRNA (adenine(2503)-C(2))-methyltransferase RlmN [Vicinamibacteria bacterium]